MNVDGPVLAVRRVSPQGAEQHFASEDACRLRRKRPQKLEFDVCQLNGLSRELDRSPGGIDLQLADLDHVRDRSPTVARQRRAAQQRAHPAAEFTDRERLRDVVVGAELETEHLVELLAPGRQHDDRHVAVGAKPLTDLEPVNFRQHQIEDDQVDSLVVEEPQRLLSVPRLHDSETVAFERKREEFLERILVVDEQDGRGVRHCVASLPAHVEFAPPYYSHGMAAIPPPARSRARPGSLERPINGRLYRGTWLLVGIPLLIAAFSVGKPSALRAAVPSLPPAFDKARAVALTRDLAQTFPDRSPGSPGAASARQWFADQMGRLGLRVRREPFSATIPGRGRVRLENLIVTIPGRSPQALAVLAHLDDVGTGPGANDNASGVAALVELARSYATSVAGNVPPGASIVSPAHTLFFVATDGGEFGGLGADRFAADFRDRIVAAVALDSIAGQPTAGLMLAGLTAREASADFVETTAARIQEQTGALPRHPSGFAQLLDLAFPFTLYEHGPLLAHGLGALTITTAGERPPPSFSDTPGRVNGARLAGVGRSAQELLRALDEGAELVQGTSSYVYLGPRVIRGWAIELVLIAALLPFLIAAIDLFARCRRRHLAIAPALRSYRSRLAFWIWVGALFELFALAGVWPRGADLPISPHSTAARHWPLLGVLGLGVLAAVGWALTRARLAPRRQAAIDDELAGHTAALLALGVVGLLVVATNPYALILVLPSLHAWLWLPQVQSRPAWLRCSVFALGFLGPFVLLISFATRYGLGLDAPWYLAELVAIRYVSIPTFLIGLAWLAVAAQLAALIARRYGPYPSSDERRLGPVRSALRLAVLTRRERKKASEQRQRAVGG